MNRSIAAAAYTLLSVVITWPLILGLGSDVPFDLGDSLLNMWILAWGADHIPRLLVGAVSWQEFWNANIFYPEPLALTFSEHLFGQSLQILPIYWITGNIILCYNLLFLSTFALSAYGTYLLVRDLTGNPWAAFVAGLIYGFTPYRIAQIPHMQVMSSHWMPFALYGLNRFITTGSNRALAGGTAALVMQNWSCGYYLLYFAPFVPTFVIFRMWTSQRLTNVRVWLSLTAAAIVTLALTLPFLLPYLEAQQRFGFVRAYPEVVSFAADVWSYITASEHIRFWRGTLRYFPHNEGETFLGFMPWIVAIIGLALSGPFLPRSEHPRSVRYKIGIGLLVLVVISQIVAVIAAVIFGGLDVNILGIALRARTPRRLMLQCLLFILLLIVVSKDFRFAGRNLARSPLFFFLVMSVLAMWFSLGPEVRTGGIYVSGIGLYNVLYDYVPGFRGVRVPARFAMIAALFLAAAAGCALAIVMRRWRTAGLVLAGLAGVCAVIDSAPLPLLVNQAWVERETMPPARVFTAANAPAIYQRIKALPAGSAIAEFPFGDAGWEIRYVYYSAVHWKPVVNGYSGAFPPAYKVRQARFQDVTRDPEASWTALIDSKSTHVVFHPQAFRNPAIADAVKAWLESHGATVVETTADGDMLYDLHAQRPAGIS